MTSPTTLTVHTARGPVTFTTSLEWDEAMNILRTKCTDSAYAQDLVKQNDANRFPLTKVQCAWVYRLAQQHLDFEARQAEGNKPKATLTIDVSNIFGSLIEAKVNGLKKPMLRFQGPNGTDVRIKLMSTGRIAGGCWVTMNNQVAGHINDEGLFTYTGRNTDICSGEEFIEWINAVNLDVFGACTAYGKITTQCSCCGIPLTNDLSIRLGIGPICREKFGF